jgi:ligand-binding sensor domain-containing protein
MQQFKILLFAIFFQQFAIAQQFNYTNFTTSQGLPSSEVYDILQDRKGYMWFATDQGVARYNGKEFTTYTIANGLLDNTVLRMAEDSKGRIWFMSHNNEICYWQNDSIYKSPLSDLFRANIIGTQNVVSAFFIDSCDNVWINSIPDLHFSNGKKNYTSLQRVQTFKDCNIFIKIVDNKRTFILEDHNLSLGMDLSASHFTMKLGYDLSNTITYKSVSFPGSELVKPIRFFRSTISKDGTIFLSFNNLLFSISKNKEISITKFERGVIGLSIDSQNGLWVGFFKNGVSYFKNSDLTKSPVTFLNNYSIGAIFFDHEGGVWMASLEKGVFYIPSTSIFVYTNVPVLNDHIVSINKIKDKLLVNTFGRLMYEVTPQHATPQKTLNALQKKVDLITLKQFGNDVFGAYSRGLIAFDSDLKLLYNRAKVYGLGGTNIFQTKDHTLWLTDAGFIIETDNLKKEPVRYKTPARIMCALPQENDLVLGTKKGLYLFKDRKFYTQPYKNPLLKSPIAAMIKDQNNDLWMATIGNGVLLLKNDTVTQFQKKDGLTSNICTAITKDQYNNIWVGTNNGLTCIKRIGKEKKSWYFKNITIKNGINSDEITKLYADQNTLWVGTIAGLSFLQIDNAIKTAPPSPTYIRSIKINNKGIGVNQHEFPYNENNLKFELNGLTYSDNGNHRYRYRLTELDTSWQETTTNEILINNLAPGNYKLQAQVANTDNIWSVKSATYLFTINNPFWRTWWFILLEVLLASLIVYFTILWRTSIIRKKEREKLKINKLLAEYQMKALTAQMNPHFIFNAINSIQNFIIQNHSTLAYDYLIKFSSLIRMVLNNSKDNEISIQQELETLAIYVELEQLRFENSFDYYVNVDPHLDINSLVIPALLLQPYIENAIWHGLMPLENRKGTITLTIIKQHEFLKITITDDGIGRKASDLIEKKMVSKHHRSIGMELTGKRIEVFGQESKFSLQIIDNHDETNQPTGTTVEIILPMVEMY